MCKKKPMVFAAENVKRLMSVNKKKAIKQIVEDFSKMSYYVISSKVINFADYGVLNYKNKTL